METATKGKIHFRAELLSCPECHGTLKGESELVCSVCARSYPVVDGVPCFAPPDLFYDDYAARHCPFASCPAGLKHALLRILPFWSWREWKFWRRTIPKCDRLLEFGCGRGREIFLKKARATAGVDGSLVFLRDCAERHDTVALAHLPRLPFRSAQFDVVASSHTIGHIGGEQKDELVSEIARVLKPGGLTAHIIETDSDHPAVRAAKQRPEAYRKQFIEQHGHIGLEPADQVIERFVHRGFELKTRMLVDAILPSVLNYRRFFDVPELAGLPEVRWSRRLSRWTDASGVLNAAYEVAWGAFHLTAEQWFGEPRHAQFMMASFVKTADVGEGRP